MTRKLNVERNRRYNRRNRWQDSAEANVTTYTTDQAVRADLTCGHAISVTTWVEFDVEPGVTYLRCPKHDTIEAVKNLTIRPGTVVDTRQCLVSEWSASDTPTTKGITTQ